MPYGMQLFSYGFRLSEKSGFFVLFSILFWDVWKDGKNKLFFPLFCPTFRCGLKVFWFLWVEYEK